MNNDAKKRKDAERKRIARKRMTVKQRARYNVTAALGMKKFRAKQTQEEKEKENIKAAKRMREKRSKQTKSERLIQNQKAAVRMKKKRSQKQDTEAEIALAQKYSEKQHAAFTRLTENFPDDDLLKMKISEMRRLLALKPQGKKAASKAVDIKSIIMDFFVKKKDEDPSSPAAIKQRKERFERGLNRFCKVRDELFGDCNGRVRDQKMRELGLQCLLVGKEPTTVKGIAALSIINPATPPTF